MKFINYCMMALFILVNISLIKYHFRISELELEVIELETRIEKLEKINRILNDKQLPNIGPESEYLPIILSIIKTESAFNPKAVSYKGALGLMQLMPYTANEVADRSLHESEIFNPEFNIVLGFTYFKSLKNKLSEIRNKNKRLKLTIASYNAGFHRVKRSFGCRSTECYIARANLSTEKQFNDAILRLPQETIEYVELVEGRILDYRRKLWDLNM